MLISEIEKQIEGSHYAQQLFGVKRCFGSHSKIGVLIRGTVFEYGTLAELEEQGLISKGFLHLDKYFANVPTVKQCPYVEMDIPETGGPMSPWSMAEWDRAAAESRAKHARMLAREESKKNKSKIGIRTISQIGQCIFTVNLPGDGINPTMQLQMPAHVAKWLKAAADDRSDSPNDFAEK